MLLHSKTRFGNNALDIALIHKKYKCAETINRYMIRESMATASSTKEDGRVAHNKESE